MNSTKTQQEQQPTAAFPPPPGETANLLHPADHLYTVNVAVLSVCLGLITVAFALRCFAKYHVGFATGAEDWSCAISWALAVFYIATCYMMARYGEGHHAWEVTLHNYQQLLRWLYASSIVWIPAAFFAKATLLLLTARVFAVYRKAAQCIRLYIAFLLVAYLPVQGVKIFICTPIKKYWDSSTPGSCLDQPKVFLTDTAMAFVTDFIILCIPIPLTWKLQMPTRKKLKIVAMLGAGGCAVAVACYREYKIYVFQWSTDVSGDFVVMNLCGTIELAIGIICACLPSVNLLLDKRRTARAMRRSSWAPIWPSWRSWVRRTGGSSDQETLPEPTRTYQVTQAKSQDDAALQVGSVTTASGGS